MDIVDTQPRIGRGKIDETLEAMGALGIRSILLDEFWGTFSDKHPPCWRPPPGWFLWP